MYHSHSQRQEENKKHLAGDGFLYFSGAHPHLFHDLESFPVIEAFRNLLIIDNQHSGNEEQYDEKYADKKDAAVQLIKIRPLLTAHISPVNAGHSAVYAAFQLPDGFLAPFQIKKAVKFHRGGKSAVLCLRIARRCQPAQIFQAWDNKYTEIHRRGKAHKHCNVKLPKPPGQTVFFSADIRKSGHFRSCCIIEDLSFPERKAFAK